MELGANQMETPTRIHPESICGVLPLYHPTGSHDSGNSDDIRNGYFAIEIVAVPVRMAGNAFQIRNV
jgi:hypothetical protein